MPPENPWMRWAESIREASLVDKSTLTAELLKLIQESSVSEDTKRDFAKITSKLDKTSFMSIARNHREDIPELRRIYDQIPEISNRPLGEALITAYKGMSADDFRKLAEHLQTKYFIKDAGEPGNQLPPAMENK